MLSDREIAFSRIAVERGFAPRIPVQSAMRDFLLRQRSGTTDTFDDHLVQNGILTEGTREKVLTIVDGYERDLRLTRLALRNGFVRKKQVFECLKEQNKQRDDGRDIEIGAILVDRGYLTPGRFRRLMDHMDQHQPRSDKAKAAARARKVQKKVAKDTGPPPRQAPLTTTAGVPGASGDFSQSGVDYEVLSKTVEVEPPAGAKPLPPVPTEGSGWELVDSDDGAPAAKPAKKKAGARDTARAKKPAPVAKPPKPFKALTAREVLDVEDIDLELPSGILEELPEDLFASRIDEGISPAAMAAATADPEAFTKDVFESNSDVFPIPDWVLAEKFGTGDGDESAKLYVLNQGLMGNAPPPGATAPGPPASPTPGPPGAGAARAPSRAPYGRPPPPPPPPPRPIKLGENVTTGAAAPIPAIDPGRDAGMAREILEEMFPKVFHDAFEEAFREAWERAWAKAWREIQARLGR